MIQVLIKRDGRIVDFNPEKIVKAVRKAMLRPEREDKALILKNYRFCQPEKKSADVCIRNSGNG